MSDVCKRLIYQGFEGVRETSQIQIDEMMADIAEIRKTTSSSDSFRTKVNQYLKEATGDFIVNQEAKLDAAAKMSTNIEKVFGNKKGVMEGLASVLRGTNLLGENNALSLEARARTMRTKFRNYLDQNISDTEAKLLRDRSIEKDLISALENPNAQVAQPIKNIANVIRKARDMEHAEFRKAGIKKGYVDNYIANQGRILNPDSLRKVSKSEFVNDAMANYDLDASFPFLAKQDIPKYFETLYDGIISRQDDMLAVDFNNLKIAPDLVKGKLLRRNLQPRKLVLKEGGFNSMWQKYADQPLVTTIVSELDRSAMDIAAFETFGASGLAGFDSLKQKVIREMQKRGASVEEQQKVTGGRVGIGENINNIVKELNGTLKAPPGSSAHSIFKAYQTLEYTSLLGGSTVSALTDPVIGMSVLSSATGQSWFKSFADVFSELMTSYPKAVSEGLGSSRLTENREIANYLSIAIESGIGDELNILGAQFSSPKNAIAKFNTSMAKTAAFMNKINPIGVQARTHRVMATTVYAQHLHKQSGKAWDKLNPYYQANFKKVGIDAPDWEAVKLLADEVKLSSGRKIKLMSSEFVDKISDDVANTAIAANKAAKGDSYRISTPDQYRADIERKINVLYDNFAQDAAPNPGVREKAILNQGTVEGTLPGTLMRSLGMLKSFSIKMGSVTSRIYNSNPTGAPANRLMAAHVLGLTGAGYAVASLKAVLNNETPPDPTNPKTLVDSFVRGGAGALYSDFLISNWDKSGKDKVFGLMGPAAGTAASAIDLTRKTFQSAANLATGEEDGGLTAKDLRTPLRYIPGNNLWYLDAAMKWTIYDELKNEIDPDHSARLQKRLEDRQGLLWEQNRIAQ